MKSIKDYFKNGYRGQSIHILRNGFPFDVSSLFGYLQGSEYFEYESIINGDNYASGTLLWDSSSTSISATLSSTSGVINPNSTVIKVVVFENIATVKTQKSGVFNLKIYIHDYITSLWSGPDELTFTKYLSDLYELRVYARFDTGVVAELNTTFYPSDTVHITIPSGQTSDKKTYFLDHPGTNSYVTVLSSRRLQVILDDSLSLPISKSSLIRITIPSTSVFYPTTAHLPSPHFDLTIYIRDIVKVKLLGNALKDIDNTHNFIFFGDGFLESEEDILKKYVANFSNYLFNSETTLPWNNFKENINVFYCNLPSRQNSCSLIGDFMIVSSATTLIEAIEIDLFIGVCNSIILEIKNKTLERTIENKNVIISTLRLYHEDYKWKADNNIIDLNLLETPASGQYFSQGETLSWMIGTVGMPTPLDIAKTLAEKVIEWRHLENPSSPRFRVEAETTSPYIGKPIITPFLFSLWLKMCNAINFTATDTSFSTVQNSDFSGGLVMLNLDMYDDNGYNAYEIGVKNKKAFNKFISKLEYNSIPIGLKFYDINKSKVKDGNNTVVFSKVQTTTLTGVTIDFVQYLNVDPDLDLIDIGLGNCRVVTISGDYYSMKSGIVSGNGYIPAPINPSRLGFRALNTALHEICHNYLDDEYAFRPAKSITSELVLSGYPLNLQSKLDFIVSPSTTLDFNQIKWIWPRITKVALSKKNIEAISVTGATHKFVTSYFKPETSLLSPLYGREFQVDDVVLLRRRLLGKYTEYYKFDIVDILPNLIEPFQYTTIVLNYTDSKTLPDLAEFHNLNGDENGALLILPIWRDDGTYLGMIHPEVLQNIKDYPETILNGNGNGYGNSPQLPKSKMLKGLSKAGLAKENVVGLYPGGNDMICGDQDSEKIFHSTGFCLMRSAIPKYKPGQDYLELFTQELTNFFNASRHVGNKLCPVCAYIITDKINPLMHPIIDSEYEKIYPKI